MKRDDIIVRPASVIVCADPFQTFIDAKDVRPVLVGQTLADIAPTAPGKWLCVVGDRAIPPDLWHHMPRPGSVVQWRCLPQGGGGDNGGSLRAVLQIAALVAISSLTGGLGSGFGATLFRTGLFIAANALIANLVPIETPGSGKPTYSAQVQGNQARLGQPIPEIFGYDDSFPDIAAQPYNFYELRTEQYLHVLLCIGTGQLHICRISVGDTDILNFEEVEIVRIGPGQSTMDGPGTGVEDIEDQTVVDPRWFTNPDAVMIEMRPGKYTGPHTVCPPEHVVDTIGIDLIQPQGMTKEVRMRWRFEAQLIDDLDVPIGPWIELGSFTTTRETNVAVRWGEDFTVPVGRYWVQTIRTDEIDETNLASIDVLSLLSVRGHDADTDVNVSDCTFVAIKVRATGQLNGALRFRARVYRMLPVWDGDAWGDPEITRNPAWALAQVVRSRGVPDDSIDLSALLTLAPIWDARYDSFDFKFGEQVSTWDAMATIARVGRAVPIIRGSRYTVVRDGPETLPVAAYGMRNILRGSMRIKPVLASSDQMRTLDGEYLDPQRLIYQTVTAQIHNGTIYLYKGEVERAALGIPAPDPNRRGRIRFSGVIGRNHAFRMVAYTMADRYYRSVDVEFDSELDGQLPAPLNLVAFQHDVGDFGETGDVVTWDAGTRTLQTTEPMGWADGTHYIRFVRPTGHPTIAMRVTRGTDDYEAIIDSGDLTAAIAACTDDQRGEFEVVFEDADRERTRYYFGSATSAEALCKVRAIVPSEERRIGMRLVLEDDRVHTVDAAFIAPDQLPACEVVIEEPVESDMIWATRTSGWGLSGGDKIAAENTLANELIASNLGFSSGKWVWAMTITVPSGSLWALVGLVRGTSGSVDLFDPYAIAIRENGFRTYGSSAAVGGSAITFGSGTVIMFAFDADDGMLRMGTDGTWSAGDPNTGVGFAFSNIEPGTWYLLGVTNNDDKQHTFELIDWPYAVPAGYQAA